MKLSVIALDYDGTIARGEVMDPDVCEAIAAARSQGIVVLLVTGKILDDLRRVAGSLHLVDGVVAENGAVLHFPDSGHTSTLAPSIPQPFVTELQRRGIAVRVGRCLVDADAGDAQRILEVIRGLELPLVLAFNGGRVMTLPQGVSKATGLRTALETLRLSARNTLAIGDRENDHELLRLAEVGMAVEWGSPALRAVADMVVSGAGPEAVGPWIRQLAGTGQLPMPPRARRRLSLGFTEDGREFSLAVKGRNVLVAGDAKSGKSWLAGLVCEQLILHGYCVCVIDPEGDYRSLEALPHVAALGGEDPPPSPKELLRALRYPDRSVVIDLSHLPHDEKILYIRTLLPTLNALRQSTGLPHRILLDEAHYFLHEGDATELLDLDRQGYIVVTYCASRLPSQLLSSTEVMLVTCESNPAEVDALCRRCAGCGQVDRSRWSQLSRLRVGQAIALPITEEAKGELRLFSIGPRLTPHVRHRAKYIDVPVSESKAFVFAPNGHGTQRARTLREFVTTLDETPLAALDSFLRRGDFSRWVGGVFGDYALAAELRALESGHRARTEPDVIPRMADAIRARYDLSAESTDDSAGIPTSAR
ncbi:MAG TPA: HAD hydrolase family protein [Vicinamibacterales bacterium]